MELVVIGVKPCILILWVIKVNCVPYLSCVWKFWLR